MKKFRKTLSVLLCLVLLASCFSSVSFAANDYEPDYDRNTPAIIIHGIGQNDTYVVDDEGNRVTDKNGDYITGWPLELDIGALILRMLPNLVTSLITRSDSGLSQAAEDGAYKLLYAIHKDADGNYEKNIEVPCYKCPMSELPEDVKTAYYNAVPVQELGEIIGEDNLYYFGYDSFGDVAETAKQLHEFITQTVLPQTGAKQVTLCPISLGGSVAVSYTDTYADDFDLIKKIVYIVPAINGSEIVGDLLTGNLSIYDDDVLYNKLMVTILGDSYGAYLLNVVLRALPSEVLKETVMGLARGAVEAAIRNSTQLWALCPTEYYEQAAQIWLSDAEHSGMKAKVDSFMQARANFESNQNKYIACGGKVYDLVCYDLELFPLSAGFKSTNSDFIIHSSSTSMGATFAPLGETLGENYQAVGTYCSDPTHNHLSPDGEVDPTTGLLPDTTWYFKGQSHSELAQNDVCLRLATQLIADNNMIDVYSNVEAYPQFNAARNVRHAKANIDLWEKADKSALSAEKVQNVENAVAQVKALMNETVIDESAWKQAQENLEDAVVDAGIKQRSEPSLLENMLKAFAKIINKIINFVFAFSGK